MTRMHRTLIRWRALLLGLCALAVAIGVWDALSTVFGAGVPPPARVRGDVQLPLACGGSEPDAGGTRVPAPVAPLAEIDRPLPTLIDVRHPPRLAPVRFLPSDAATPPAPASDATATARERADMLKRVLEENARRN